MTLLFDDLDSLGEYWLGIAQNALQLGFVYCFSHSETVAVPFGEEEITEVTCGFPRITSRARAVHLAFSVEVGPEHLFSGFSTVKSLPLLFPCCVLWREAHAHPTEGEACFHFLEGGVSI